MGSQEAKETRVNITFEEFQIGQNGGGEKVSSKRRGCAGRGRHEGLVGLAKENGFFLRVLMAIYVFYTRACLESDLQFRKTTFTAIWKTGLVWASQHHTKETNNSPKFGGC